MVLHKGLKTNIGGGRMQTGGQKQNRGRELAGLNLVNVNPAAPARGPV
jgi:hypothetical protein